MQNVAHKLPRGVYIEPAQYGEIINELCKKPTAVCIVGNPGLGKTAMAIELHNDCLQVRLHSLNVGWLPNFCPYIFYNYLSTIQFAEHILKVASSSVGVEHDVWMQKAGLKHLYSDGTFLVSWGRPTRATESDDDKAMEWIEKLDGLAKKLDCTVTPTDTPNTRKVGSTQQFCA